MKHFLLASLYVLGGIASIPFLIGVGAVVWELIEVPVLYATAIAKYLFEKLRR